MPQVKFRQSMGASSRSVAIVEGTSIAGGNAVEVNFDFTSAMSRYKALRLLGQVRQAVRRNGWPLGEVAEVAEVTVTALVADTPVVNVGGDVVLTVTISAPAAPGADQVTLTSDGPEYSPALPQTITFDPGATEATITLTGATGYAAGTLMAAGLGGIGSSATLAHEVSDIMVGATIRAEGRHAILATTPATVEIRRKFQLNRRTYLADGTLGFRKEVHEVMVRRPTPGTYGPRTYGDADYSTQNLDLTNDAVLSTAVLPDDVIPGATANNSTEDLPVFSARWVHNISYPMGNTGQLRLAVQSQYPRDGLPAALVRATISDGVTTVTVDATAPVAEPFANGLVSEHYAFDYDISAIADGDVVTVSFVIYGHEGQTWDGGDYATQEDIVLKQGAYQVLKHDELASSPAIAWLADVASGSPVASLDSAVAKADPFANTPAGRAAALAACRVLNNSVARTTAYDGCDGALIYVTSATDAVFDTANGTLVQQLASGHRVICDPDLVTPLQADGLLGRGTTGSTLTIPRYGVSFEGFRRVSRPAAVTGWGSGSADIYVDAPEIDLRSPGNATPASFGNTTLELYNATILNPPTTPAFLTTINGPRTVHWHGCTSTGTLRTLPCNMVRASRLRGEINGYPFSSTATGLFSDSNEFRSDGAAKVWTIDSDNGHLKAFRRTLVLNVAGVDNAQYFGISSDAPAATNSLKNFAWNQCSLVGGPGIRGNMVYNEAVADVRDHDRVAFNACIIAFMVANKSDQYLNSGVPTEDQALTRQLGNPFNYCCDATGNWWGRVWDGSTSNQFFSLLGRDCSAYPAAGVLADPGFVAADLGTTSVTGDIDSDLRLTALAAARGATKYMHGRAVRWDAKGVAVAPDTDTAGYLVEVPA